ncbi:MAG: SGNH/GDSL hydrolase family protein [Steroidobacteraceae bacterium]|jgi:lysophospholipase L1-like esterase|nr:SGNH/GDSL hydrolase family protein [Steroidobacteraceae bacterium]
MLAPHERRWWPWAPVLLAQGLYARVRAGRMGPAESPQGRVGNGPVLRLAGLGDSIIAGIGVAHQSEGLTGQVAQRISAAGATVEWNAIGTSGATAASVLEGLLPLAREWEPEFVILSVGVNDAVRGTDAAAFKDQVRGIVEALTGTRRRPAVVFAGIPPLEGFPALPRPLATLLGERARRLQQRAVDLTGYRGLKVVSFPPVLAREAFARDGFHPRAEGCAVWAGWVADGFALRLAERLGDAGG